MAAVITAISAVSAWIAFGVNTGIAAKVKEEVGNAQPYVLEDETMTFQWGAAPFLPLGSAVSPVRP